MELNMGVETKKAMENFPLSYHPVSYELIRAMVTVKYAAAQAYKELDIEKEKEAAIILACERILHGGYEDCFVVDALSGGAGTSIHMNVNEVIAALASKISGKKIHPIDDVNRGQSTNDVFPTALRVACITLIRSLSHECEKLQNSLERKEKEWEGIKKLGRTELMDAIPITLGEEFGAYAQAIARDRWRIYKVEERLRQINLGGTAVGTYETANRKYRFLVIEKLRKLTDMGLAAAEYPMDLTQNNDVFVEVSGLLKALAVNLMKISNDLRLMNSGPHGGLQEIRLKKLQNGSSIMPGKVNPVIPEMTMQCAMKVMANDQAISLAACHGEFELNAFLPLIADSLLESLSLLNHTIMIFRNKCIDTIEANPIRCQELLDASYAFAASYIPMLGYDYVSLVIDEKENVADIRETLEWAMKKKGLNQKK